MHLARQKKQKTFFILAAVCCSFRADGQTLDQDLATFLRLLKPQQASASEINDFITTHPDWPARPTLNRRYAEALAAAPDGQLCQTQPTTEPETLLACGRVFHSADAIRAAWRAGAAEHEILPKYQSILKQSDEEARFLTLETTNTKAAEHQLARLSQPFKNLAAARLALRQDSADAPALLNQLSETQRTDPALLLAHARFLRRATDDGAAITLWRGPLAAAEAATPLPQRAKFWNERDALARDLLAAGNPQDAYALADDHALPTEQALDAQFLAGFIALRHLHDTKLAQPHFAALAALSPSAITQARAYYWLAECEEGAARSADLARAAAWPLTYYGQLAARALGETEPALTARIAALRDPIPTPLQQEEFEKLDFVRAARLLQDWHESWLAGAFLRQLARLRTELIIRAQSAALAQRFGLTDVEIAIARMAGRDGGALPQTGWPAPLQPAPPPLVLAIIRQESSFDPNAQSPAGAIGLMQLMPSQLPKIPHSNPKILTNEALNMRLGTAYLNQLKSQFAPSLPAAIAAYNAGPRHVQEWLALPGPEIDWIEELPYAETRSYIQRVLESTAIYAARMTD